MYYGSSVPNSAQDFLNAPLQERGTYAMPVSTGGGGNDGGGYSASVGYGGATQKGDYYDPQSGVASIGWGRRLDDPNYAARMASINDWNTQAANVHMAKQQALQAGGSPASDQLQVEQGLMKNDQTQQDYSHLAAIRALTNQYDPTKPVASSRYGNELKMGGKTYDLGGDIGGMTADQRAQQLRDQGEQENMAKLTAMRSGNFTLGSKSHPIFADPKFLKLIPAEQDHLAQQITGASYADHVAADNHTGGGKAITYRELQQLRNLPALQKQESDWADQWHRDHGVRPSEALQYLVPGTTTVRLPSRPVQNKGTDADHNPWVQAPPQEIQLTSAKIARLKQHDQIMNNPGLRQNGAEIEAAHKEKAQLEAAINAHLNAPIASVAPVQRPQMTPEQMARSRASLASRSFPPNSAVLTPQMREEEARRAVVAQQESDRKAMQAMRESQQPGWLDDLFSGLNTN